MAIFTRTDRPKSVRNRCVFEGFCGVFVLSSSFVCRCRCFCHRNESNLYLFLRVNVLERRGSIKSSLILNTDRLLSSNVRIPSSSQIYYLSLLRHKALVQLYHLALSLATTKAAPNLPILVASSPLQRLPLHNGTNGFPLNVFFWCSSHYTP